MPVSILNPIATLALDLRLSNLPVNGDFSDTTGLSFIGGRAPGNPMGWQVTGGDVFTDGSATNLRLGDDGAAVTDFGVLTDDALVFVTLTTPGLDQSTVTYTDGGQPVTGDVALYADLMIGSEVIATRAFALDAAGSEGWTATLDLTGADLSAHTIGETGISLRIRNESGTEIAIDNVASDEAVSTRVRLTGSVTLSAAPAVGTAVSVENIAVTEPYAVVDAADLAPYLTATLVGDRVDWVLDAPRALVEELAEGDTLDLGFDVQVTEPAETPQTASVTVTLTGVNDAPLAQDGTGALDEDGTLSGTLLATDPDESDSFTFALRSAPAKGVVTIDGATGDYTYMPNAHAVGDDSFTFVVRDAGGAETLGTVTLTIAAENDVPALVGGAVSPQSYELLKDGDYAFYLADFLFDDPDGDKADMVLTISGHDGKGDLVIDADFLTANALMFDAAAGTLTGSQQGIKNALTSIGKIAYRDSSGDDVTLSFAIRDNGSTEGAEESLDLGQISLTIVTNPEAQDASVEGVEDVVLQGQLVAIEEDGDPVTFALRAGGEPKFGTVTVTASGAYTYTPKADYYGSDSFEFTVTDGNTTSIGTVTISIANLADTPVAGDELVLVQMDGSRKGLLDGVSTGDDPVVFALAEGGAPQNGTLTLLEDGRYTYTPDAGFSGFDSFTFGATAAGLTNFATGRIYVFADADTPVVGDLVLSTIGTDGTRTGVIDAVDQSDDVLTFSVAEGDGPSDGTLVMGADGRFTFTPADGQSGLVEFTVTVSDGAHEATRLVSFSVDGALDGDGRLVGTVEADLLQGTDGADQIRLGAGDVVRAGEGDDLVLVAGDGTGAVIDGGTGKDQVRVEAGSGVADLTGSSFTGVEELVGNGAGLRFDGELDLSGVALVTGTGDINGGDGDDTLHGSMLGEVFDGGAGINRFVVSGVLADFTVVVTGPNAAEITNGQGLIDRVSNVAEIVFDDYTYVLDGANPAPVVRDDAVAVDAGTDATIAAATLLANDEDVEGESLTITSVTGNEDLAVTLDGSTITVTPSDEFDALAQGESADVSFDYTVTDSDGSSASASVTVTVDGVNDAPVAGADEAETASYTKLTGNVLGNDSDVDAGATLSVTALDGGAAIRQWFTGVSDLGAKLRIDPDGSYHYDPRGIFADLAEGETVVDTFRYTVSDEFGATSTETVSISVTGEAKPELGDYEYADHARAGSVISEADGLLAEAVAQAGGQVTAVAGGTAVEIHELVDGAVEIRQAFAVAGSDGGRFEIDADGAIRFDPGRDFDDLKEDQTRTTTFDFTVTQGNGRTFTGTSKVIVAASDLAPKIETTLSEPLAPTMSATTVSGSFDQQGGIDVISELFGRLDDAVPFDLDALLDFDVIDIDSLVKVSFSPDTGIDITLSDNSVNPDALITGLGEKLDPAADFVSDVVQSAYALPLQPVYFGPNFDIEFGMQAKLGWDIDLPSLGKTAVFQPVELDLLLPDAPVEAGQSFFINTNNMKSLAPTTAVQTVGLGDFKLDASYGVTHAKLADVGLVFGTHNFLNLKLDDVFDGGIYLNSEFDLLELTGSSDQASFDSSISLSMRDILDGVLTLDFGQFVGLVQDFAADPGSKTAQALGGYVMDALAVVAENAAVRIDLGNGVEVKPSDLVAMVDRIPFNEFDGRNEFGEGVFLLEDADGTEVAFTGAALIDALDNSDVSSALDEIKTMLTEGFSPIGGVNFFGNLPLDNVEIIDGFGDGDMDTKSGTHQIEVVQTTRLAGLSVDFDELAPEVASIAIDKITEGALEAAKSQPYLIPIVVGASIGAQAALELNQQTTKVLESGFASQLKVQPFDLVAAAVNPFIEGMNAVVGVLNTIMGAVPLVGSALQLPTIPLLTREGLETAFDATIDAMTDGLGFVINGMASVASDLLTAIANNPLVLGTADFLGDVAGFGLGAAGDALNKIADILGLLSGVGGIGGAVDSITGILNGAAGVVHAGANAARNFENAVQNMLTSAASLANETAANVEAGIDKVGSLIKDIARGVDMQLSTEFDFFSMVLDAGVDLVQIAKFDPDEVEVTYTLDGFTSDTHKVGDPAQFFASGNPGDVLDGKAVYSFAGDVDYDYRLKLDIVPNLTLYGIDVEGDIKIGENTSYDIDFDYAAVKTTQDFGIDDLAGLDPRDLFDDALLELPLGFVEEIMEVVADGIRSGLGEFAGQSTDLDFNELRLFELKDIALDRDQFSTITEDFQVEIGSNPPTPHIDLRFDENTDFATASNTLLQGFDGEMNKVKGSSLNFGKLFSMMGGNLFVTPTGAVVYADGADNNHLNVGDTKEDTFTYQVKNADGSLSWLAARVVIDGVNDAPVAIADTGTVAEDGSILLDVLANDTDVDDGASFTLVSGSSPDGTVTVEGNQLRVAPGADFTGAMVVTYTMADEHGAEAVGEAVITVTPVADDVRAVDDAVSISEEGAPLLIDVTANDIEVDGETITIEAITQPSKGTLEIVDGQNVRFDHAGAFDALLEGETEVVTATVTVTDGTGASQTQTLTITVEGANDAPTAVADLYTLDEDASGTFSVLDNDFDADVGGTFTLVGAQDGPNGSVTFDAATGQVTYTPDADFYGQDTFTYTLEDEQGAQSTGTVTVNVTPRGEILREGTATDDIFLIETPEDGRTVIFEGGDGVDVVRVAEQKQVVDLTDAEFVGIETLDLNYGAILLSGEKGHIDLSTVGQVINTRGIFGNSGTNTIFGSNASEVISGGLGADVLMGNGGNDVFLLGLGEAMGDIIDGGDGFDVVRANLLSTTLDIEGATFRNIERLDASGTYLQVDRNGLLDMSGVDYIHNTSGLHGSDGADTIRGSQSDDYIDSDEGADVLEGNDGDDIFGLSAGDHRGTVIDGGDGNDLIQLAAMEGVASLMGVSFTNVEGLDGNNQMAGIDGDFDLGIFASVQDLAGVQGGVNDDRLTADLDGVHFDGGEGTDTLVLGGSIFDHAITDGGIGAATITLPGGEVLSVANVEAIEFDDYTWSLDGSGNGPLTTGESYALTEGDDLRIAAADLMANDRDLQDEAFSITSVTSEGGLIVSLDGGDVVVDASGVGVDDLAVGETRDETFTYTVTNARGATSTQSVTVTVTGINDAPVAADHAVATDEDTLRTGNLMDQVTDADTGAVVTVTGLTGGVEDNGTFTATLASGAVVTLAANGDYTYDPRGAFDALAEGAAATDSFSFEVTDNEGATDTATITIDLTGVNDGPASHEVRATGVARGELDVPVEGALLVGASDPDGDDALVELHNLANGTQVTGSNGGTFTLNADGSYSFDAGEDFDHVLYGESVETAAEFQVRDGEGKVSTARVVVDVEGPDRAPTIEGDGRFGGIIGAEDFAAQSETRLEHSFEQQGSVNVVDELIARLDEASGFDLNSLLDVTLLDINKRIDVKSEGGVGTTITMTDIDAPEGVIAPIFDDVLEAGVDAAQFLTGVLPLDFGAVELTPTFEAQIGLDVDLGWDIDLPTLGRTTFFQPVGLDFSAPTTVEAGEAFVLTSDNLVSETPTAVSETLGLGAFSVKAGFAMPETSVTGIGFDVRSSDFGPFDLGGLAQTSIALQHEFTLEETMETAKSLAVKAVDAIAAIAGNSLPVDPADLLDTILSLDVSNIIEGLFNSNFDFTQLLDLVTNGGSPQDILSGIMDMLLELSEAGAEAYDTASLGGVPVTDREVYDMAINAKFNDFDGYDDNGTGYFELDGGVRVTAEQVDVVAAVRDVYSKVNNLRTVIQELGVAPVDGLEAAFDIPVGNVEEITEFGGDTGHTLVTKADGTQKIQLVQKTDLVSLDVDFQALQKGMMQAIVDLVADAAASNPAMAQAGGAASAMQAYLAFADAIEGIATDGVRFEMSLNPAALVANMANAFYDVINLFGKGVDAIVPGDIYSEIAHIDETDALDALDDALSFTNAQMSNVFDALESLIDMPLSVLNTVIGVLDTAYDAIAGVALEGVSILSGNILNGINSAIGALESAAGVEIRIPIPFSDPIVIKPLEALLSVPIAVMKGFKAVLEAGVSAVNSLDQIISDITDGVQGLIDDMIATDLGAIFDTVLDVMKTEMLNLAEGASMSLSAAVNPISLGLSADLSVTQIAEFDPDEVAVTYSFDGYDVDTVVGNSVGFYAPDVADGTVLDGQATYSFSGDADYKYRVGLDVLPQIEIFGVKLDGDIMLGKGPDGHKLDFDAAYALAKNGTFEEGNPLSHVDEALLELPFEFLDQKADELMGAIYDQIGLNLPFGGGVEDGELVLFQVNDVEIDEFQFNDLVQDFQVTVSDTDIV